MSRDSVVVIGGGFGGLSAAIRLASAGKHVTLLEMSSTLGGKAGCFVDGDFQSDTGPSVLTMVDEAIELLSLGEGPWQKRIDFIQATPAFRYIYPDGTILNIAHSLEKTIHNIRETLGTNAAHEFQAFMHYSQKIWDGSAPLFIHRTAPSWIDLLKLGLQQWRLIPTMDPFRNMQQGIKRFVQNPYLQNLLLRYATYNGSDPRQAPATLNCIAHVELALGGYGVRGGISNLVGALVSLATELGVEIRTDSMVQQIRQTSTVQSVILTTGEEILCCAVVVNADASHFKDTLLETVHRSKVHIPKPYSMSGWTAIYEVPHQIRVPHTVLFPDNYLQEFIDIFDKNRPPNDPTIYVCAQTACHQRPITARNTEALFVMINTPPEPEDGASTTNWVQVEHRVRQKLQDASLLPKSAVLRWSRTPSDLSRLFPGSRGAIYGSSSNNRFAAFTRPSNALTSMPGIFLASGSAHPGGGMPMAMISGKLASEACIDYLSNK